MIISFGFIIQSSFTQTFDKEKLDSFLNILEVNNKFMGSVGLSHKREIIYLNSFGYDNINTKQPSSDLTRYRIGSILKLFTATLILRAVEENKLELNNTINGYFSTIKKSNKITVSDLLYHRSGLQDFLYRKDYKDWFTEPKTRDQMIALISENKQEFKPGKETKYSNANYVLLTIILEEIFSKTYSEILKEKILDQIDLKNTYVGSKINPDKNECFSYKYSEKWIKQEETDLSIPLGGGSIVSTPSDLILFIEKLFAGELIRQESLEAMITMKDWFGMGIFSYPFFE